jgi:hypothetical protein
MREELEADGWRAANVERYLETMVESEQNIDIWVDADGLARRVVTSTSSESAEVGMTNQSVTTSE